MRDQHITELLFGIFMVCDGIACFFLTSWGLLFGLVFILIGNLAAFPAYSALKKIEKEQSSHSEKESEEPK